MERQHAFDNRQQRSLLPALRPGKSLRCGQRRGSIGLLVRESGDSPRRPAGPASRRTRATVSLYQLHKRT